MPDFRPQEGAQSLFLSSPADIAIYGGSSGSGKTFALLLEAARHIDVSGYNAVLFRREFKQIVASGGIRDAALQIYPLIGGLYRSQPTPQFLFNAGSKIGFAHLNTETETLAWQGAELCFIGFDELTHYTLYQVEYLMSRNRSTCGVRPLIRATTNPDADSWVKDFISWWLDDETGYPIPERSGKLRYMIRVDGVRKWGNSVKELVDTYGCDPMDAKSVTFVSAKITDNPILLRKDPGYLANLKALDKVERARLLEGNWKIRAEAGMYFPRDDAVIIDWKPKDGEVIKWIRSWDLAASEASEGRDPDWTVGILGGRKADGKIVIADVIRLRRKADYIESLIRSVAFQDGKDTWVCIPQDPGAAGKQVSESYQRLLSGFTIISRSITKNKVMMASAGAYSPAALWQQHQIELVRAPWNKDLIDELDAFPTRGVHDDQADSLSAIVRNLPGHVRPDYSQSGLSGKFKPFQVQRTRKI